jgi:23S rRNA pseudouridine2605 synthase
MVRLQKFLAEAGVASRRAGEQIILAGRVAVNGSPVNQLGTKIDPARDRVSVDGTPVKARRKLYVALNKPRGYICSRHDPLRRRRVADLLPDEWTNLYSVGRLDYDTEGLLFLTNDGDFCLRLTHPRYGVGRKYLVTVEGRADAGALAQLTRGVLVDGEKLRVDKARLLSATPAHSLVEVELREGKYREVRRLFESQGLPVRRLRRTQIGRIRLGDLPAGKWRMLTGPEIRSLLANTADTHRTAASKQAIPVPPVES